MISHCCSESVFLILSDDEHVVLIGDHHSPFHTFFMWAAWKWAYNLFNYYGKYITHKIYHFHFIWCYFGDTPSSIQNILMTLQESILRPVAHKESSLIPIHLSDPHFNCCKVKIWVILSIFQCFTINSSTRTFLSSLKRIL